MWNSRGNNACFTGDSLLSRGLLPGTNGGDGGVDGDDDDGKVVTITVVMTVVIGG